MYVKQIIWKKILFMGMYSVLSLHCMHGTIRSFRFKSNLKCHFFSHFSYFYINKTHICIVALKDFCGITVVKKQNVSANWRMLDSSGGSKSVGSSHACMRASVSICSRSRINAKTKCSLVPICSCTTVRTPQWIKCSLTCRKGNNINCN